MIPPGPSPDRMNFLFLLTGDSVAEARFVEKRSFRERREGDQCVMTSLRSMMRSWVMDL